jgi:tol-pal system protein YbgF
MSVISNGRRRLCSVRLAIVAISVWVGVAHAGLFDDDEARKAILDLRQRIDASRQSSDTGLQRLQEVQNDLIRRNTEETAQLRRSLVDLQNQIESLRSDFARLNGQNEQAGRDLTDLQRRQKDLAQGQQELVRGVDERVSKFEPGKVTVDGREFLAQPAERAAFEAALASFRAGDFTGAQSAFLALLSRYPKSGYGPSSLFWLGNAQYATRDYKEAIINFRILLTAVPDHPKAPEALLSIANCQVELKDLRGAKKSLEDLAKNYPQSEAAQAGKERLARLR